MLVHQRVQSDRRKLRINKWVWHGVAMDPSEMCGSEPPKLLKSYSWIDEIPQHDTPGSALASPKKYFLRRHLSFHNCHVAKTGFHEASKHPQAYPSIKKWGPTVHGMLWWLPPENLVSTMFPDVSWRRLFRIAGGSHFQNSQQSKRSKRMENTAWKPLVMLSTAVCLGANHPPTVTFRSESLMVIGH